MNDSNKPGQAGGGLPNFAMMPGQAKAASLEELLHVAVKGAAPQFLTFPTMGAELPAESASAAPPAPAIWQQPSAGLIAARRDWLLGVMDNQRRLSPDAMAVQHRAYDLSGQEFLDHFYAQHRPVVIEGAALDWPAVEKWTPEYLARKVGGALVEYQGERTGEPDFELAKDRHKRTMPFDAFIAMVTDEDAEGNNAYITAYNDSANAEAFAPLLEDLGTIDEILTPKPGMMWVGPADTFTPLHFDLTNNLLVQVSGLKAVTIVSPEQTRFMYHSQHVFSEIHDLDDPDRYDLYPLARHLRPTEIFLSPGDALYIPLGWWHQVRSLEFSVTMTHTNFRWPNEGYAEYPGADA